MSHANHLPSSFLLVSQSGLFGLVPFDHFLLNPPSLRMKCKELVEH